VTEDKASCRSSAFRRHSGSFHWSLLAGYSLCVGKASDWLREERRKTLGDWVAFCPGCGFAQRYFDDSESELPAACPQCDTAMRVRCPVCNARFSSAFAVECEVCSARLRAPEQFGIRIRRV
jgi:ribosomal protein S27E